MPGNRLSFRDRESIRVGLVQGWSLQKIAREIGGVSSTVQVGSSCIGTQCLHERVYGPGKGPYGSNTKY